MSLTEPYIQAICVVATLAAAATGSRMLFLGSDLQTIANDQLLAYPPLGVEGPADFQWSEILSDTDAREHQARARFYTILGTVIMFLSVVFGLFVSFPQYFVLGSPFILAPIITAWRMNQKILRPLKRRTAHMRELIAFDRDQNRNPWRRYYGRLLTTLQHETDAQLQARIEQLCKDRTTAASGSSS
jgi:hypothetical protein